MTPLNCILQDPLYLDKCIACWEQEWEDCFEVQEFAAKEGFIFKAEDIVRTTQWFRYVNKVTLLVLNLRLG